MNFIRLYQGVIGGIATELEFDLAPNTDIGAKSEKLKFQSTAIAIKSITTVTMKYSTID